ncbi:MAG: 5-formyltetrahydrofolate cyclo-ligase, partial [Pseudomonadota bacterium]
KINQNIINNFYFIPDSVMACYYTTNNEVNCDLLLEKLFLCDNIKIALPAVEGKDKSLTFRQYQANDQLVKNKFFNFQEPAINQLQLLPNYIIVPILAFNKDKYRLGYGGGFYDRTIDSYKESKHNFITIGAAYDFQLIADHMHLPVESHDQQLDYIVTETEII